MWLNYDHILLFYEFSITLTGLNMTKEVTRDKKIVENVIKPLKRAQQHNIFTAEKFLIAHQENNQMTYFAF